MCLAFPLPPDVGHGVRHVLGDQVRWSTFKRPFAGRKSELIPPSVKIDPLHSVTRPLGLQDIALVSFRGTWLGRDIRLNYSDDRSVGEALLGLCTALVRSPRSLARKPRGLRCPDLCWRR
jgi:hypothetical protein